MPNVKAQLDSHIQAFVTEISGLVRVAALEAVRDALGGGSTPAKRGPGRPKGYSPKAAKAKAAKIPARPTRGGRRVKRSSEEVDAMAQKFLAFVKANDGKRLEEISKGLGIDSHDLKLPASKLLAAKAVKTTGQKRGTKYHAGGGGGAAKAAAPAPKNGRRGKKA
jgi:hypothetical protein